MRTKLCLLILGLILLSSTATATKIITQDNFENGFSSYWYRAMNDFSYSGNPSTNYSVSPSHSYRFELHNTDAPFEDGIRSELEGPAEAPLQERIYNFSIYLPKGGAEDYAIDAPDAGEVIVQWHNNPDEGEEWTRPPLALLTDTYNNGTGYYYLSRIWDEDPISNDTKLEKEGKMVEYDLGSYEGDKGRWVNWSFHVKWGWLESQNPKLEVFKDGKMILNLDGLPNTTNDTRGVNQQFGIYKWAWNQRDIERGAASILTSRVIYFDDVSVLQVDDPNITTPTITWSNPANITYGTPLNSTQLNAAATDPITEDNVTGNFTYTPAAGTVLSIGTHKLHVDFTPNNTEKYATAFKDVTINVSENPVLPVANFISNVAQGPAPLTVQFTDLSKNATTWNWNFGDGNTSTEQSPTHIYSAAGTYTVSLTATNENGTSPAKTAQITVTQESSSSGGSSGGSSHHSSSGGGGGGSVSPEPASNVEVKEISQSQVSSGKPAKFDFARNATCVVSMSFDAKKTAGKTTAIAEQLKGKSTLVSVLDSGEVYKYFNLWVGTGGFATSTNIENPVVYFKVEKSWLQDKKIDQNSIILNRYSDKKWSQLPVKCLNEDNKYLYFTAQTPEFSFFAITGKAVAKQNVAETKPATSTSELKQNNTKVSETEPKQKSDNENPTSTSGSKQSTTSIPGFEVLYVVACLVTVFMYKRK